MIFGSGPICTQKSGNSAQGNCNFQWKLKEDGVLNLADLDSWIAFFDFSHLQGVYWGQSWTKNANLGGQFRPNLGSHFFFLLNFTRILWYFWDLRLTLFDIAKDTVFLELLVFSNIFGFPAIDWAQKWTKTVIFQCVPFDPNFKTLKNFSNNELALLDYLWSKFQQDQTIFWGIWAKNNLKMGRFMDAESIQETLKTFNFTTTDATLMKLTRDIYLNKAFHLAKSWGVIHRV